MRPDLSLFPKEKENFTGCFACGRDNPIGLKLEFQWDGQTARAEFIPKDVYQGWPGITHGAIIIALLDEVMSYACYYSGFNTVTGKISARLKKPVATGERLTLTGQITRKTRKLLETKGLVTFASGEVAAQGEGTMFILDTNRHYAEGNR
jgi:acyl-coenzyme A thioesterase PaaI-like protein